jgi:hypothetical protein
MIALRLRGLYGICYIIADSLFPGFLLLVDPL